jgi:hypothetical protein
MKTVGANGKLNLTFMEFAKAFFVERGHHVTETFVERGYDPEDEVAKHSAADLVILQTPVNWFCALWIYRKYVDEVFTVALAQKTLLEGDGRTRQASSRQYGTGSKMQGKKFMVTTPGTLPEKPSIILKASYTAARERRICFCTLRPTTNSAVTTFSRIMEWSIFSRTPTSHARLQTTSGIWRNTAYELVAE